MIEDTTTTSREGMVGYANPIVDDAWIKPGVFNQAFKPFNRSTVQLPSVQPFNGERDPAGLGAHEPGAKLDAGKVRAGLVLGGFARALLEVSKVGTFGAAKYSPTGWIRVEGGVDRYTDALHRHLLAEAIGEALDDQTDLLHAAHAAWNALARLDLMLREREQAVGGPRA